MRSVLLLVLLPFAAVASTFFNPAWNVARVTVRGQGATMEHVVFASGWNRRGAWRDSLKFNFEDGWRFPWGDGHLSSVEVMSWGEIRPASNITNVIAGIGVPVSIVPGLT